MYKPNKDTQKLKDLIDEEFRVKGYIRWPYVESFLKQMKKESKKEFYDLLCNSEGSSLSAAQYRRWYMDEFSLKELVS